jgi:hypothetical protein
MSPEERVAIQTVVMHVLGAEKERVPTLLIDTLLNGDGYQLVHQILAQQAAAARQQADTLSELLRRMTASATPAEPPPAEPAAPAPPLGAATVPTPYPRAGFGRG